MDADGDSAPCRWREIGQRTRLRAAARWICRRSQFELHSIISDFPAHVADGAVCGARFIEHGIRIVEMNQNAAAFGGRWKLLEHSIRTGERHMADFASGL